jgi:TetR/AcrR family transcriptional repressor of bet genes
MPKQVDHQERRRAIARAAVDVIGEHGLDGVKLADIGRMAGVTTGAIAHYFPDKDAVLAAALEQLGERLIEALRLMPQRLRMRDLVAILPTTPESAKHWRVWLAYWGRAAFAPPLRAVHARCYGQIESLLSDRLAAAGLANPERRSSALIAALDGLGTRVSLEPEQWPAARQEAVLAELAGPLLTDTMSTPVKEGNTWPARQTG